VITHRWRCFHKEREPLNKLWYALVVLTQDNVTFYKAKHLNNKHYNIKELRKIFHDHVRTYYTLVLLFAS